VVLILRSLLILAGVLLGQLYVAPLLTFGKIHPDFILILLVYFAARNGRILGISLGFGAGLLQDITGAFSVLGANAMAKAITGYALGTLNGTETVWTRRIVNFYVYGSIIGHSIIYEVIMAQGLNEPVMMVVNRILIEASISGLLIIGLRFFIPLLVKRT